MRIPVQKLAFFWLILALVAAPLQALELPVQNQPAPECPMHADSGDAPHAHADSHCPACVDQDCECMGCNGQSCATPHLQLSVLNAANGIDGRSAHFFSPHVNRILVSLTCPPLDRPPAV